MIGSFTHRGLRQLFEEDIAKGVNAEHIRKIKQSWPCSTRQRALRRWLPTFRLHELKGDLQGHWAVTVRANWRIIFRFEGGKALDVDLVDYHWARRAWI